MVFCGVIVVAIEIRKSVSSTDKELPVNLSVLTLDGIPETIEFMNADTTLVLIFNSECDLCIIELEELLVEADLFKNYKILLLSSQESATLIEIIETYSLNDYSGIQVYRKDELKTQELFFNAPNPSVFVYANGGKLIFSKKGYTHPQILLKEIRGSDEE